MQNKTNELNRNRLLLQVIISGRELIIQDNSSKFRKEKQILNLLPYLVTDEEKRNKNFVDWVAKDEGANNGIIAEIREG